jgi:ribosomal protein S18 acetylase RimI-like enzyme
MLTLRKATLADLDFLIEVDLQDEGCESTYMDSWGPEERAEHRDKIAAFVSDPDKAAWVWEDTATGRLIGMSLWRYRNRLHETFAGWSIFPQLDERLFPADGAFCEIFQLWVAPEYRRRGLASRLKQQAELESLRRGVLLLYTHTEERNTHVLALNLKLGYREVRRGPIWDDIVRISLIKPLG